MLLTCDCVFSFKFHLLPVPVGVPDVKLAMASPTSMVVSWSRLPGEVARGVITQHEIRYRRQHSDVMETIEVSGNEYEHVITGWLAHSYIVQMYFSLEAISRILEH